MNDYVVVMREGVGHGWTFVTIYPESLPAAQKRAGEMARENPKWQYDIRFTESVLKRCWDDPVSESPEVVRERRS